MPGAGAEDRACPARRTRAAGRRAPRARCRASSSSTRRRASRARRGPSRSAGVRTSRDVGAERRAARARAPRSRPGGRARRRAACPERPTSRGWRAAGPRRACASRATASPCRGPRRRWRRAPGPGSGSSPRRSRAARVAGSSDLKMPEPTNTPSAPSCITSDASAGVAMPPAQNSTTGSLPSRATWRTRSSGAWSSLAAVASSMSSERAEPPDLAGDAAQVADGLDDVAGAGLALGADHRRALADPAQRLAEVGRAAHERDLEAPTCRCGWPRRRA